MNPWLQALVSFGVGGVLVAVINGLFSKRKLSADATKIITEAASGVVERLKDENLRMNTELAQVRAEQASARQRETERDRRERERDHAILLHGYWDQQVFTMARDQGLTLPEPPPLPSQGATT